MATKITKSELKQMIREALREELRSTKHLLSEEAVTHPNAEADQRLQELRETLDTALATAIRGNLANVLITRNSDPRLDYGVVTTCRNWASKQSGVKWFYASATDNELIELDKLSERIDENTILILDNLERGRPKTISAFINSDSLLTIAISRGQANKALSTAQARLFNFKFDFINNN